MGTDLPAGGVDNLLLLAVPGSDLSSFSSDLSLEKTDKNL